MSFPLNEKAPGADDTEGKNPFNDAPIMPLAGKDEGLNHDLEAIIDEHANSPSDAKQCFIGACKRAFVCELAKGPCTLSEARKRHGIRPPVGVDGRAAGVVPHELHAQGIIRPAGFSKTPWLHCHSAIAQRWELVEGGAE